MRQSTRLFSSISVTPLGAGDRFPQGLIGVVARSKTRNGFVLLAGPSPSLLRRCSGLWNEEGEATHADRKRALDQSLPDPQQTAPDAAGAEDGGMCVCLSCGAGNATGGAASTSQPCGLDPVIARPARWCFGGKGRHRLRSGYVQRSYQRPGRAVSAPGNRGRGERRWRHRGGHFGGKAHRVAGRRNCPGRSARIYESVRCHAEDGERRPTARLSLLRTRSASLEGGNRLYYE